jgi:hypothetical protein
MQSLHDAISAKLEETKVPKRCKFGLLRDSIGPRDRDALDYAVKAVREGRPGMTKAWLVQLLKDHDYDIGKTVVSDHLREVCACVEASE